LSTLANAVESLNQGAIDFLPKPFAFEELSSTVQRACRFLRIAPKERKTMLDYYPHRLGISAWATVDADGTARLGFTSLWKKLIGEIEQAELPELNADLQQGGMLAQIVAQDQLKHAAWSALSGRVIAVNRPGGGKCGSGNRGAPYDDWVVRIVPVSLETELVNMGAPLPASCDPNA